jgi:hypothetical protein
MMLHLPSTRIDKITDRANLSSPGVAVVRSRPVSTTAADALVVLPCPPDVPLSDPSRPVGRFLIPDRAVAAPTIRPPHRVLSP